MIGWFRRRRESRRKIRLLIGHAAWVKQSLDALSRHDPDLAVKASRGILDILDEPEPDDPLAQPRAVTKFLMGVLEEARARGEQR